MQNWPSDFNILTKPWTDSYFYVSFVYFFLIYREYTQQTNYLYIYKCRNCNNNDKLVALGRIIFLVLKHLECCEANRNFESTSVSFTIVLLLLCFSFNYSNLVLIAIFAATKKCSSELGHFRRCGL